MSSAYDHRSMFVDMTSNVSDKMKYYSRYRAKGVKQELKLVVYGDEEPLSYRMWRSIFRDDIMHYTAAFPRVPLPPDYTPEYIALWAATENFTWGLYNLAAPEQDPRMHLVIAKRRVKRSELGCWANTDKSESLENDGAHQDARFISIESLRALVSDILDFDSFSSLLKVETSTSSSSTSSDERSADPLSSVQEVSSVISSSPTCSGGGDGPLAPTLERNEIFASIEDLLFDDLEPDNLLDQFPDLHSTWISREDGS